MRYLLAVLLLFGSIPAYAVTLEDGKGTGNRAEVNSENQLVVNAITSTELEHESEANGQAYNWTSGSVDIDAADTVLLLKNTSDTPLHIEKIAIDNGSIESAYTVHLPTSEVTLAGGSAVTGSNLNTTSSNVADASARSDETNNSQGLILSVIFMASNDSAIVNTDGLILGKNKSLGIDVTANTTESSATIIGHYQD